MEKSSQNTSLTNVKPECELNQSIENSSERTIIEATENVPTPENEKLSEELAPSLNSPKSEVKTSRIFISPVKQSFCISDKYMTEDLVCLREKEDIIKNDRKVLNTLTYECNRKKKELNTLTTKVTAVKESLKKINLRKGHYSVRNVNKRDSRARENLKSLRETQHQLSKLKINHAACADSVKELNEENKLLREGKKNQNDAEQKKIQAQKTASYYRVVSTTLRNKLKNKQVEAVRTLKTLNREKDQRIHELEDTVLTLQQSLTESKVETKGKDGKFSDKLRMCVIELGGLEVAVEKIPEVIKCVSKHVFNTEFKSSDVPSSSTAQNIIDEGHFLAKTFISEKLAETENWGLNRDGTTRKKQKLLDTSVTLSSGEVYSLGFSRVAHETAETIQSVTENHLVELGKMNSATNQNSCTETFITESLKKLAFTMSDRASNEKKAARLLDEWRDEILSQCPDQEKTSVHHFHCMAHVLLGFHRYICQDLKDFETTLCAKEGPLSRDQLPVFKFWKTKGAIVERLLSTVSDVFGPCGDHHGVHDLWEGYCGKCYKVCDRQLP